MLSPVQSDSDTLLEEGEISVEDELVSRHKRICHRSETDAEIYSSLDVDTGSSYWLTDTLHVHFVAPKHRTDIDGLWECFGARPPLHVEALSATSYNVVWSESATALDVLREYSRCLAVDERHKLDEIPAGRWRLITHLLFADTTALIRFANRLDHALPHVDVHNTICKVYTRTQRPEGPVPGYLGSRNSGRIAAIYTQHHKRAPHVTAPRLKIGRGVAAAGQMWADIALGWSVAEQTVGPVCQRVGTDDRRPRPHPDANADTHLVSGLRPACGDRDWPSQGTECEQDFDSLLRAAAPTRCVHVDRKRPRMRMYADSVDDSRDTPVRQVDDLRTQLNVNRANRAEILYASSDGSSAEERNVHDRLGSCVRKRKPRSTRKPDGAHIPNIKILCEFTQAPANSLSSKLSSDEGQCGRRDALSDSSNEYEEVCIDTMARADTMSGCGDACQFDLRSKIRPRSRVR